MAKRLVNGIEIKEDAKDRKQLNADRKVVQDEEELERYKYERIDAYGSVGDQLDLMYHEGIEAWKAHITAVKEKYPKPEAKE